MEIPVSFEEAADIWRILLYRTKDRPIASPKSLQGAVIHPLCCAASGVTFQHGAKFKGVGDIAQRPVGNEAALRLVTLDQKLTLQPSQSITHRGPRHAAAVGKRLLPKLRPGRQFARQDHAADTGVGAIGGARH